MNDGLYAKIAGGIVRHFVSGLFLALAARGYYSANDTTEIVGGLTVAIVMAGWSIYQKIATSDDTKNLAQAIEARLASALRGKSAWLLPMLVILSLGGAACAVHYTTPAAAVAGSFDKVEQSGLLILHAAQTAAKTPNPLNGGKMLISQQQLVDVAIGCDKLGRLGTNVAKLLNDYNAAKAAGASTTALARSIQALVADAAQTLADIGKAVPSGTVQALDSAVASALGLYAQIKAAAL